MQFSKPTFSIIAYRRPSIYDVHKKITFLTPLCPHGPDPLPLWTSTRGRHEIHTALLKWLVQLPQSALEFSPIHCPNDRLGQDLGFGGLPLP